MDPFVGDRVFQFALAAIELLIRQSRPHQKADVGFLLGPYILNWVMQLIGLLLLQSRILRVPIPWEENLSREEAILTKTIINLSPGVIPVKTPNGFFTHDG